jgi:small-conductance mechanosensitive channel
MRIILRPLKSALLTGGILSVCLCRGQAPALPPEAAPRAAVVVDGETLFSVRGFSALPAEKRAAGIAERIQLVAAGSQYAPGSLRLVEENEFTTIQAGEISIMSVTDADAAVESVSRAIMVKGVAVRIDSAIQAYRSARTTEALLRNTGLALALTAAFAAAVYLFLRLYRRVVVAVQRYSKAQLEGAHIQALAVVESERLWTTLHNALQVVKIAVLLAAAYFYFSYVLGLFPWTRLLAVNMSDLILGPLRTMLRGVFDSLPNLAFLAVLFFVVRYLVKLTRLVFNAVERGTITISSFDPDWSGPTFRIARILIIAFGLVVAYPYLPGSGSEAFKGVSLFVGVIFSLGSTGVISNMMAGYSLTYRRAYRVGDRVEIGGVTGDVEQIRLQVTHLRSLKNEEIIIPNSVILNSNVMNYSSMAKERGLILHTTVGIGYETPWRQVEAMLLMAAERTPDLLRQPPPFVLQKLLGDFCVTYELNVYCDRPKDQMRLYTSLHRNILDVFNEYGVQIMTPAYEGDPTEAKVVPKEKWFESPADSNSQ